MSRSLVLVLVVVIVFIEANGQVSLIASLHPICCQFIMCLIRHQYMYDFLL